MKSSEGFDCISLTSWRIRFTAGFFMLYLSAMVEDEIWCTEFDGICWINRRSEKWGYREEFMVGVVWEKISEFGFEII